MKFTALSLLVVSVSLVAANPTPDPKPNLAPWGSGYSSALTFGNAYKSCGTYRPFCCKRKEYEGKEEKQRKEKEGKEYGKEYSKKEYSNEKKGKGYGDGYKVKYGEDEYECECEEFYGKSSHSGWRLGKLC